jgi:hypothetical protein
LANLDHRKIVAPNQVNKGAARAVDTRQILFFEVSGDD